MTVYPVLHLDLNTQKYDSPESLTNVLGYNKMFENYPPGFPNREVEQGFFKFLLPNYASVSVSKSSCQIQCFVEEVMAGKVDDSFDHLKTMFADIPYKLPATARRTTRTSCTSSSS